MEGQYAKRKVFDKIGLEGSDKWINMGKARIRAILESAKNIQPKDISVNAVAGRQINSFDELNNLDVVIKIGVEHDQNGQYRYFTFKSYSERLAKPEAKDKGKALFMLF